MMIDLTRHATLNKKRSILNRKAEPPSARLGRRRVWATLLLIALSSCLLQDYSVANDKTNHYRQWAFIQLNNLEEFYCLDYLYYRESRWNPKAVSPSGNHFGIPQGKSQWLKTATPYQQINWGIKYNKSRYGSMCKALEHYKLKGWH
jgi:hypothetical protein